MLRVLIVALAVSLPVAWAMAGGTGLTRVGDTVTLQKSPLVTATMMAGGVTAYQVEWVRGQNYSDIMANCGDTVSFNWNGTAAGMVHDVGIADGGDCSKIDDLTPVSAVGNYKVTLDAKLEPIAEDGEIYFACSVGGGRHCTSGQMIEFYVDCSDNMTAPGMAPVMGPGMAPKRAPTMAPGMAPSLTAQNRM